MNDQLVSHIKQQLAKGKTYDTVVNELFAIGWSREDIDVAFSSVQGAVPAEQLEQSIIAGDNVANATPTATAPVAQAQAQVPETPTTPAAPTGAAGATPTASAIQTTTTPETKEIQINPEPLPSVIALIKSGFSIYRQRLGVLVAIGALQATLSIVFFILVHLSSVLLKVNIIAGALALFVSVIVYPWVFYWFMLAGMEAICGYEQRIGFVEAFKLAYSRVWSFLWLILISFLILVGISAPIALLGIIITMSIGTLSGSIVGMVISGVTAMLLWIVMVSIFALWFTFSYWVFVDDSDERVRGIHVLSASREIVRGRLWAVSWRLFATAFLIDVGYMLGALIINAFVSATLLKIALSSLLALTSTVFFIPLLLSVFYSLYEAVKIHADLAIQSIKNTHRLFVVFAVIGGVVLLLLPIMVIVMKLFIPHTLP